MRYSIGMFLALTAAVFSVMWLGPMVSFSYGDEVSSVVFYVQ